MKSQKLLPLLEWSEEVFRIGREQRLSTTEITESIKVVSKERGWEDSQINKVLRHNGILKPIRRHVINVRCPKCEHAGRLNSFHDSEKPGTHYVITHGLRKGTWGKTYLKKRGRCYFYNLATDKPEYYKNIINQLFPIPRD